MFFLDRHLLIRLFVIRRTIPGVIIQFGAFLTKHAAGDRQIILKGVSNKIHRLKMPVLKIHLMNLLTFGTINNMGYAGPYRSHAAHATWLES